VEVWTVQLTTTVVSASAGVKVGAASYAGLVAARIVISYESKLCPTAFLALTLNT
jgi:hypothetical protein